MDGDASYVELLINNGMSPSTCDYNQRTPLHLAASNGHTHIVHFLCNQAVCPTSLSDSVENGFYRLAGVSLLATSWVHVPLHSGHQVACVQCPDMSSVN